MFIFVTIALIVIASIGIWAFRDYRKWLALGPGGLPSTFVGWLKTTRMRFYKTDPLDTDRYRSRIGSSEDSSLLGKLPTREGARPTMAVHPVPHRQLNQFVGDDMRRKIQELFDSLIASRHEVVEYKHSYLEKCSEAVFLCHPEKGHAYAVDSHGEVGHIHPSDSSMHLLLGPSDATAVIVGGWGERHPLAGGPLPGTKLVLPDTYIFIYPPRNDFELGVTARILDAAVNHMAMLRPTKGNEHPSIARAQGQEA